MERTDKAFLLSAHPLGESDLILTLLAETAGRVRGVARSARKSRKRFGGALEPMSSVRVRWFHKPGRDLHRIESLELVESFASMQADPVLQAACAVLSEIAASLCGEGDGDRRVFRLLKAVLEALRDGTNASVVLRYFEFWMLRLHGLLPDLTTCVFCHGRMDAGGGTPFATMEGLACGTCAGPGGGESRSLGRGEMSFLGAVLRKRPDEMNGHETAARPGGVLEWMLRGALQAFVEKEFRTYRHYYSATSAHGTGGRASII